MNRVVIANDLPYTGTWAAVDPLASLRDTLAFSSRDWGEDRDLAWIYGIVFGWGPDLDDPDEDTDAYPVVAARFGWDAATVDRLKRLHARFEELT